MNKLLYFFILACSIQSLSAQETNVNHTTIRKHPKHSIYFSWGYNGEWYTRSAIKVHQPELGNNYQLNDVKTHDHKGWNEGIFNQALTIPQYNYRLGYFINEKKGWAIELNFDHTKHIVTDGQTVRLTGTLNNVATDKTILFSNETGFHYYLNNGANFFLFNLVKRATLFEDKRSRIRIDALGKAGVGPVIPHVDNSLFSMQNDAGFQLGGWNVGTEGDIKVSFLRYIYFEYGCKLDYARYSGLKVYKGTAKEAFGTFEMILSLGVNIPWGTQKS